MGRIVSAAGLQVNPLNLTNLMHLNSHLWVVVVGGGGGGRGLGRNAAKVAFSVCVYVHFYFFSHPSF